MNRKEYTVTTDTMKRRIIKANVRYLSLCPMGATRLPVMYKAEDGTYELQLMTKAAANFEERGELLAVVYAPELVDSQNELASGDVIKEMMYSFAKNGHEIDMRHNNKAVGRDKAYVAEQTIIQKGDERFSNWKNKDGKIVDVTGGWGVVVKVDDAELRKQYNKQSDPNAWAGVSMGGEALRVIEKEDDAAPDDIAQKVLKLLEKKTEIPMDEAQLEKRLEKQQTDILAGVAALLKKEPTPATPTEKTPVTPVVKELAAPVLKDNPTDADLEKHEIALAEWEIRKEIDPKDLQSVKDGRAKLAAFRKELADAKAVTPEVQAAEDIAAGITKEDSEETAGLKRQLAKSQKRSNATGGSPTVVAKQDGTDTNTVAVNTGLSKEDQDAAMAGAKLAQAANQRRGTMRIAG